MVQITKVGKQRYERTKVWIDEKSRNKYFKRKNNKIQTLKGEFGFFYTAYFSAEYSMSAFSVIVLPTGEYFQNA